MSQTVLLNGIAVNIKNWKDSFHLIWKTAYFDIIYTAVLDISHCVFHFLAISSLLNCSIFFFIMVLLHSEFFLVELLWGKNKTQFWSEFYYYWDSAIRLKNVKFVPSEEKWLFQTFYGTESIALLKPVTQMMCTRSVDHKYLHFCSWCTGLFN